VTRFSGFRRELGLSRIALADLAVASRRSRLRPQVRRAGLSFSSSSPSSAVLPQLGMAEEAIHLLRQRVVVLEEE